MHREENTTNGEGRRSMWEVPLWKRYLHKAEHRKQSLVGLIVEVGTILCLAVVAAFQTPTGASA